MARTGTTRTATSPLDGWRARRLHTVTGPSGQRLRIEILGVAKLLEAGALPDDLIDLAIMEVTEQGGATGELARRLATASEQNDETGRQTALDSIAKYGALQRHLAAAAVRQVETDPGVWLDVTLDADDLDELPEDDLAMVAEIVQRLRSHDARGVRIGVEPLDRWSVFRDAHRGIPCAGDETCEGCAKVVSILSSADVGRV